MIICLGTTPALQRTMVFSSLSIDSVNRALEVRQSASGKVINVARVLHAIGQQHLAMGFLGGERGRFIRKDLDAAGIRHAFVEVQANTRMCVTVIDRSHGTATELVEEPGQVAGEHWTKLLRKLQVNLRRCAAMVMSGSLAPGGCSDFYAQCVKLARKANIPAIVDARGQALRKAIAQRPMIIKPNREELASAMGVEIQTERQLRDAMTAAANEGAAWVILTMGKHGARVTDGKEFWQVHAPPVQILSTIGCGDALAAGLAAGIVHGQSVIEACVLGAACAAANAITEVAGVVHPDDVNRFKPLVRIEKL